MKDQGGIWVGFSYSFLLPVSAEDGCVDRISLFLSLFIYHLAQDCPYYLGIFGILVLCLDNAQRRTYSCKRNTKKEPSLAPLPLWEIPCGFSYTLQAREHNFIPCQGTLEFPGAEVLLHFCPGQLPTCVSLSGAVWRLRLRRVLTVPRLWPHPRWSRRLWDGLSFPKLPACTKYWGSSLKYWRNKACKAVKWGN